MEISELIYITDVYSSLSGIPCRLYINEEQIHANSVLTAPYDPLKPYERQVMEMQDQISCFITPDFLYYGIVRSAESVFIFGPTAQVMPEERVLRKIAFDCDVPKEMITDFTESFRSCSRMTLEHLQLLLCTVNHALSHECRKLSEIAIAEQEQIRLRENSEEQRTRMTYEEEPAALPNNSRQIEEQLVNLISHGETEQLRIWSDRIPSVRNGILASDQIRQLKNTFIVTATVASRAAIQGGLDAQDALAMSDRYISQAEQLSTPSALTNLMFSMIQSFTQQVHQVRLSQYPSKLALDAANYVRHHISEVISTEKMAREFYMSRTHLSARFHRETGMTLSAFILKEKTEEAKRLLIYSDKKAAAISSYLGFSSQSHFSRVFKEYSGYTPQQFRELFQKSILNQ